MTLDFQRTGSCMMALMMPVTYACPSVIEAGGCSLTLSAGKNQATCGTVPASTSL